MLHDSHESQFCFTKVNFVVDNESWCLTKAHQWKEWRAEDRKWRVRVESREERGEHRVEVESKEQEARRINDYFSWFLVFLFLFFFFWPTAERNRDLNANNTF